MNKKTALAIGIPLAVVVVAIILVVALNPFGPSEKGLKVYQIGFQTPLTGPIAKLGEERKNAFSLAVEQINNQGGINGIPIEVSYQDNRGDPKTGVSILQQMISVQKLKFLYVDLTPVVYSAIPIVDKAKVIMFAGSAQADITATSPWVFRIFQSGAQESEILAKYLHETGVSTIFILHSNELYGNSTKEYLTDKFGKLRGNVMGTEEYPLQSTDFRTILGKAKASGAQRIVLLGYGSEYPVILKQAQELEIPINSFVANLGGANYVVTQLEPQFTEGMVFIGPAFTYRLSHLSDFPVMEDFVSAFEKRYGHKPDFRAAYAYDSINILAMVLKKTHGDLNKTRDEILKIKDYQGACGKISFRADGDSDTEMILAKYVNGKIVPTE